MDGVESGITKAWQCDACGIRGSVDVAHESDDTWREATREHKRRSPTCEGLLRLERPFISQAIQSFSTQRRFAWLEMLRVLLLGRRRAF